MAARDFLSDRDKAAILVAISDAEAQTSGEIRLHVESRCKGDVLEAGPRGEATPSETTPRERGAERPPSDAPPRGRARARGVTTTERERRAGASVAGAAEIEAIAGEGLRRNERRESMRGREPSAARVLQDERACAR